MGLENHFKGKNVKIDINNPSALGICDRSGEVFNHKDLVKQMEWQGGSLVWTGLLVGPQYLDEPQEQNKPPKTRNDPKIIHNPRLPGNYIDPDSNPVLPYNELLDKLNKVNWNE